MKSFLIAACIPALLAAGAATAQTAGPKSGEPATIPLASFGALRNFEPDRKSNDGVYIEDQHRNWYYAKLFGPCFDLPFATRVGVKSWGNDTIDSNATLIVGHDRCRFQSLVHSGPPPAKAKKPKKS